MRPAWCGGRGIGPAADQIDHGHAVDDDAQRRADFAPLGEVASELVANCTEPGVAVPADRYVHAGSLPLPTMVATGC